MHKWVDPEREFLDRGKTGKSINFPFLVNKIYRNSQGYRSGSIIELQKTIFPQFFKSKFKLKNTTSM
jgi:hypothetical protein